MEAIKTEPCNVACMLCNIDMEQSPIEVCYLGYTFNVYLMTCPKCGQVYIPEEVRNKMKTVEEQLEDK